MGRAKATKNGGPGTGKVGYAYLHSAVDGYSRLAYTEHLPNENAKTTIGFFRRARAFFAAHGIVRIVRVITDNGSNYRARDFVRTVLAFAGSHRTDDPDDQRSTAATARPEPTPDQ